MTIQPLITFTKGILFGAAFCLIVLATEMVR